MPEDKKDNHNDEVELLARIQRDPVFFIWLMWGLTPQPFKNEECEKKAWRTPLNEWKVEWFGLFIKGEHLTWQQYVILIAIRRAVCGEGKKQISIAAGRGVGKSNLMAMVILWYLYAYYRSMIGCTAPSEDQMHGALWKEVAIAHNTMPKGISAKIDYNSDFIRMKAEPNSWFARAKTARVDQPEALSGLHSDNLMLLVDEASGVNRKIFEMAEATLTNEDYLMILISNPTRIEGYFYDTHHREAHNWQIFNFSVIDSPIVSDDYVKKWREKGIESDEYRVNVLGLFPREDAADRSGYLPVFLESDFKIRYDQEYKFKNPRLGVDPAGEGRDSATFVVRDRFKARLVAKEKISTPTSIAERTMAYMELCGIKAENVFVDAFGEGIKTVQMLERLGCQVNAVNVSDDATKNDDYENLKAEAYYGIRDWLRGGGELLGGVDTWRELKTIRSKRKGSRQRLAIKTKEEMKRDGERSPDVAEALMLTFTRDESDAIISQDDENRYNDGISSDFEDLTG